MSGKNTTTQTNTTVSQTGYTHLKSTYSQPPKPADLSSPSSHVPTSLSQSQQSSSHTTIRSGASTVAPVFF
ncbi:hypothetical protein PILCRDRAFT_810649 [Piloderma croceum F 1598]|uniref:Uncharacterized protein n=1 Tax=Piloderma croceum (strain F 1598) TaxID=765440 RepID=A0A0C3GIA1_PILCF|nr:hypothetical protein PILCRDRAFT_810649 [Piloderma croceum F 1598]